MSEATANSERPLLPSKWKALVIDSDRVTRRTIGHALGKRGALVLTADTRQAGTRILGQEVPAIVVISSSLPGGLQLVSEIRELYSPDVLPVIALCGAGEEYLVGAALEVGANDCLCKPFSIQELVAKCVHALRVRQATTESGRLLRQKPKSDLPQLVGGYEIQRIVGRGAYGVVLEAWSAESERRVALKLFQPLEQAERLRYEAELAALSAINSPYSARLIDCGEHEDRPWLSMDFVPGPTLWERVTRAGPLDLEQGVQLLAGLARALSDLSAAGVLHRDLKPTNIILRTDEVRHPVLVDFGLSRSAPDQQLTDSHELRGSAGYMAPEYMLGHPIDQRSDLYALGVTAIFALTAERPFPHLDGLALLKHLCEEPPRVPESLPLPLQPILRRLVALDPEDRYPSPEALLEALEAHAELRPLIPRLHTPEVFRVLLRTGIMLGMSLDPAPPPPDWRESAQRAAVQLRGAWEGQVTVTCSPEAAQRLGTGFLGIPAAELEEEDLTDAVAEVANVLAGQVKRLLPQPALMSLPFVPGEIEDQSDALVIGACWGREPIVLSIAPASSATRSEREAG